MKTKLKYLKLFEGISQSDIPYSRINKSSRRLMIDMTYIDIQELPEIYNQLTNEIGYIFLTNMPNLTHINSFKNLTKIKKISIWNLPKLSTISGFDKLDIAGVILIMVSPNLKTITGFNNLTEISGNLRINDTENLIYISGFDSIEKIGSIFFDGCNKLIFISIPSKLINSVGYKKNSFISINLSKIWIYRKQESFINDSRMIKDCIDKFDPSIHPDVVVKQIIENLEIWGEPDTITTIINHILSKGDYWEYIPQSIKPYVEEKYHHLYNAKYANTGARGIAKMNTGRYLGMF